MAQLSLQPFLSRLERNEDLSRAEACDLLSALLDEDATDAEIRAVLIALTAKGETVEELTGLTEGMRARATRLNCAHSCFIDTAGTGSSKAKTFNVSTAAAFVIAGAGLPVAKHGNRAASSKAGSADVLAAMGVNLAAGSDVAEAALESIGICFMFAPLYHGATARVAAIRRELGVPTTFNLLGPMSNPARAPRQVVGVWRLEFVEKIAAVLAALGTERAWVVHGEDGLDEITLTGATRIAEAAHGAVRNFTLTPDDFGFRRSSIAHLRGGDAEENAKLIKEVLAGTRRDEARSLVVMTAAVALVVGDAATNLREGVSKASEAIDSGAAWEKLLALIQMTNAG